MQKLFKIVFSIIFVSTLLCLAVQVPANAATVEKIPQIGVVSLDHYPFKEGDKNEFYISSKGYTGNVQYQLFYTCDATMGGRWQLINSIGMTDGWTGSFDAREPIKIDISGLDLKASKYRFAIRVRRVGVTGKYSNEYGNYDNAYPFVLDVVKTSSITLNGDIMINKTELTKGEALSIVGIKGSESNLKYKLHLYDVINDKWLTNLTDYGNGINFNTANIPEGTYILDMWGKTSGSSNSYDGWKLATIHVKKEWIPSVSLVSLEHYPFVEGDGNQFYIASNNYTGQVQYQLFYTCAATMGDKWQLFEADGMLGGWTGAVNASDPVKIDLLKLNLKANFYRFAIRVRRVGVKGKYSNQYGDYDYAYPFNVDVVKNSSIQLKDNILMDKSDYLKNDQLVINGVNNTSGNIQYKLHLYDVKNNRWLTNLTDYSNTIDFDLSNVPVGTYVVDMWGKVQGSANNYDGWKLAVINVNSGIKKVVKVDAINVMAEKNFSYTLPKYLPVSFEDASTENKYVTWNGIASTGKPGTYNFEGTVAGYDAKVNLCLYVYDNRGNTVGNIINGGFAVEANGWIYYSDLYDENGLLCRVRPDGTGMEKLADDAALNLNVVGDWIYYGSYSDNGNIYKIKTDGSGRTKIGWDAADQISVVNGWVYYINIDDSYKIYKIKTDGSSRTKVNDERSINVNVVDNHLYYTNIDDGKLYKCKTDGTGRTKLGDDMAGFVNVVDGWIYYSNPKDNYYLYKIDIYGRNRAKVASRSASFINVYNERIYYADAADNFALYSIKTNGTDNRLISENASCVMINISNNQIYYLSNDDETVYKMALDGTGRKPFGLYVTGLYDISVTINQYDKCVLPGTVEADMNDGSVSDVKVTWDTSQIDTSKVGEYTAEGIVSDFDGKAVAKVNVIGIASADLVSVTRKIPKGFNIEYPGFVKVTMTDGSTQYRPLTWSGTVDVNAVGEYSREGSLPGYDGKLIYKVTVFENPNTPTGEILADDGDWIYFRNIYDGYALYRIKHDGTGKMIVADNDLRVYDNQNYIISDGWVYYSGSYVDSSNNSQVGFFKIRTDGIEKTKIWDSQVYKSTISNGYVYFTSTQGLYKIGINDTQASLIISNCANANYFGVVDDWVFYLKYTQNNSGVMGFCLMKIKNDGTGNAIVKESYTSPMDFYNGAVYYFSGNGIYKMNVDGTEQTLVKDSISCKQLKVLDGWIYYQDASDYLYRIKTDGTAIEKISDKYIEYFHIKDGWIYYLNGSDSYLLYKMRIDGTEDQIIG